MSAEAFHRPGRHECALRPQIPPRHRPFAAAPCTRSSGSPPAPRPLPGLFLRCPTLGYIT
ncbi:hypothetical protein B0H10DRAFT_2120521 [Mycena sp. CBHHK59/15]|nr:hypothetical protein B0H10DRAFT_2120521 [Mycena sp. CBHHK59/15]